ncbi:MAG: sodium:proline symporter, partial [Candidatus Latescibacterota bacterium]
MTTIDWLIVAVPTLLIGVLAVVMQRYVHSVADFMSASRVAGRYLITNAGAEAGLTIVGAVAWFEMAQASGFTLQWWGKLTIPVGLVMTLWGFVIYRYRETRVMTLAQFYEVRYSKSFRVFAGFVAFVSGTINYGIFPALAGRFFIYCCGLPEQVILFGLQIPTLALIMAAYLSVTLTLTMTGGHLTIMVTDCVGSLVTVVFYTIIVIVLLHLFQWSQIFEAMSTAPPGKSLLDPFDTGQAQDFNIWYVLIGIFGSIYGYMTWQG